MEIPTFVWLILTPLIGSPLIYLLAHSRKRQAQGIVAQIIGLATMLTAWIIFFQASRILTSYGPSIYTLGSISLCFDGLSLLLATVTLILGSLVTLFSGPYLSMEDGQEKFYAMLSAMVGVMIGLGCAQDLFNLWIWFEAMAISSYLLVTFYRDQPTSLEAGVKYLV